MDLTDTIKLMLSDDKKENMLAEYYQLIIRQEMLKSEQRNDDSYSFDKFLKGAQIKAMEEYKKVLERRLQEIRVRTKKPDFWF